MTRIYLITNKINGKQYVGKTKYSLRHRFSQHVNGKTNMYIHNAIAKYGKENFTIEQLCLCDDSRWEELETFYIKHYHTHYTEGGYNLTRGGNVCPLNDGLCYAKFIDKVTSDEFREKQRANGLGRKHTEETKELCRQRTLANLDVCIAGFKRYNESKKISVAMLDENENIIQTFSCLADVARYFGKDGKEGTGISRYLDKYNKNGKRAKFWGYYWTKI